MDIGRVISGAAADPVRVGLAVAETGIAVTRLGLTALRQALGADRAVTDRSVIANLRSIRNSLIPLRPAMVGAAVVADVTEANTHRWGAFWSPAGRWTGWRVRAGSSISWPHPAVCWIG